MFSLFKLRRHPPGFLFLFLGFLVPFLVMAYLLFAEGHESIRAIENERKGLAYIERLREPLQHLQQHRGMTAAFIGDDQRLRVRLFEKQTLIDQKLAALDGGFAPEFPIAERLEALRRDWADVKARVFTMGATESFSSHNRLIAALLGLINEVIDGSGLIQEPSLDGYYMVDMIGAQLPVLTERLGQVRAIAAQAAATMGETDSSRLALVIGLEGIAERSRNLEHSLRTVFTTNASLEDPLADIARSAVGAVGRFSALVRKEILDTEAVTIDPGTVFDGGTAAIDKVFELFDQVVPALDALLQSRIDEHMKQRLITIQAMVAVMLVVAYLLTTRRRMEQAIEERTRELRAMNRELEAFSYSVSHNLRAPLRAINGFSGILGEECRDLSADARRYLERIRESTLQMSELIDGLLELSRVARSHLHLEPADLTAIAQQVASRLEEGEPQRRVTFEIAAGLATVGDPALLRVVIENLLSNAWKFTAKRDDARIEFGRLVERSGTPFYVRDNGAGFDMRFSNKLFEPFERLHEEREFAGTGVGLATVRRIVERHGGRVWAEGRVGEGATFYFTIPRNAS